MLKCFQDLPPLFLNTPHWSPALLGWQPCHRKARLITTCCYSRLNPSLCSNHSWENNSALCETGREREREKGKNTERRRREEPKQSRLIFPLDKSREGIFPYLNIYSLVAATSCAKGVRFFQNVVRGWNTYHWLHIFPLALPRRGQVVTAVNLFSLPKKIACAGVQEFRNEKVPQRLACSPCNSSCKCATND